jgi:two-component system sensor histidine kinase DegS
MDIQSVETEAKGSEDFLTQIMAELKNNKTALNEISTKLDQSQNELNRLAQKKATITAQLQQFQTDGTQISVNELRAAYNSAMDAQQRLLVMRGQLDKLAEHKDALVNYQNLLERAIDYSNSKMQHDTSVERKDDGISTLVMLIEAQESERQRLSRQMHDGPAQALSNFIVQAEIATRMYEIDPLKAKDELDKLKLSAMSTFQKVRTYIAELRPMMLDDLGLIMTLTKYVANLKEQTGVDINAVLPSSEKRLVQHLEVFLFRAIQELVANAMKHNIDNASKLRIDIILAVENSIAKATIRDNGKGFDPVQLKASAGLGLKLIQERANLLGGSLIIDSSENQGSEIVLSIPIPEN